MPWLGSARETAGVSAPSKTLAFLRVSPLTSCRMQQRQFIHEKKFKDLFFAFLYFCCCGLFLFLAFRCGRLSPVLEEAPDSPAAGQGRALYPKFLSLLNRQPGVFVWNGLGCFCFCLIFWLFLLFSLWNAPIFASHALFWLGMIGFGAFAIARLPTWDAFSAALVGAVALFALLYVWCFRRIRFSGEVTQNSLFAIGKRPGLFLVSIAGALLQLGVTLISLLIVTGLQDCDRLQTASCATFVAFFWLWTGQILRCLQCATISGALGTLYFENDSHSTFSALRRTLVCGFGSVAFASLFCWITDFWTAVFKSPQGSATHLGATNEGGAQLVFMCCCGVCSRVTETFNSYALVQVGISGKSYYEAAVDTGYTLRERGFNVVLADLVIQEVSFCARVLFVGASIGVLLLMVLLDWEAELRPWVLGWCAIVSWACSGQLLVIFAGSVLAASISFSMEPNLFSKKSEELFYRFKNRYAQFLNV